MIRKKVNISILCIGLAFIFGGCTRGDMVLSEVAETEATEEVQASEDTTDEADITDGEEAAAQEESSSIYVFVCGAVCEEGVYELSYDARVQDALDAAGGFTEDASTSAINLAANVTDGQKLYFPTKEEVTSGLWQETDSSEEAATEDDGSTGKVNINTATREELMTLSGIGETRADSIISYREANGDFNSIEDIMNVSGIGESIYANLKDSITVE